MRYRQLLQEKVDSGTPLREMARAMKMPIGSLHNYLSWETEPRLDSLKKMSVYFGEPISVLISEDDDLTAKVVNLVRRLPAKEKKKLLEALL